jgi:hypothetical protein
VKQGSVYLRTGQLIPSISRDREAPNVVKNAVSSTLLVNHVSFHSLRRRDVKGFEKRARILLIIRDRVDIRERSE